MLKRKEFFGSSSVSETTDKVNVILTGTEITGDLVSNSNILIEGEVNGNVSCSGKVQIGTSGKIKGNLVCVNADIEFDVGIRSVVL